MTPNTLPVTESTAGTPTEPGDVLALVLASLDDDKAIEPVTIDLAGKTAIADQMVVATGTSQRHIASMADRLVARLKAAGLSDIGPEGKGDSGWVLIDAGDVIVHLFRAETRAFYDIEKLWTMLPPLAKGRRAARTGAAGDAFPSGEEIVATSEPEEPVPLS